MFIDFQDAFQAQALYVKSSLFEKVATASVKIQSHIWIVSIIYIKFNLDFKLVNINEFFVARIMLQL